MTITGASEKIPGKFWDKGGAVAHSDHPDFGATGDGRGVTDGAVTTGTTAFTSASAAFTSADTGKAITIANAGTPVALTGTLTAAAGAGTFSVTQLGLLGEGSGVVVGTTLYTCTAWNAAGLTCTLSGSPTFGASAVKAAKTLTTTLTYVSATAATLGAAAGQTVSSATAHFGTDNTVALQAAIDYCSAGNTVHGTVPVLQLGMGQYKVTGKLRLKSYRVAFKGMDQDQTAIHYEGVSAGCVVADVITGCHITVSDLSIYGDSSSGHGFDFTSVGVDNVYLSRFSRLKIFAGQNAIYCPLLFSSTLEDVYGESLLDHIYRIRCGPAVAWRNVYAGRCPAGKAGYRIAGTFHPVSCNGVNSAGYWGIFGSKTDGTDGFQADFAVTDYADVVLHGCNVEAFGTTGLYFVREYEQAKMLGGTIVRTLAASFHSVIRTFLGPLSTGGFVELNGVRATISGGAATSGGNVYSDLRDKLVTTNDNTAFTGSYSGTDAALYAVISLATSHDGSLHTFLNVSGLATPRLKPTVVQPLTAALTYSATMAVNGQTQSRLTITPNNSTAFTISNPSNAFVDQLLTFTIINTTGGALGAVTWSANYLLSTWTQPATGFSRSITFWHNGSKYLEVGRTPADVPN